MHRSARRRRWLTSLSAFSLIASGLTLGATAQAAPSTPAAPPPDQKIDVQLEQELEDEGRTEFWVRLADRPDLDSAKTIKDWDERGQAVVDMLTATAEASQRELRAELDAKDVDYEAFWVSNAIRIKGGDRALATALAAEPEVEGLYPTVDIEPPKMEDAATLPAPDAIEWGLNDINAPDVWEKGHRGEGIIVASIDTGVQWDHPALINQYRGYDASDGSADHNYSWFDATGISPDEPSDIHGHGTHVTGTMVGNDGANNQIGVAPGAKWIAADGCCPSDEALISSGQWMLAPTDLKGENPRVDMRPHIINNSWGTEQPSNDPFMEDVFEAWEASGIFGVFSNGNNGAWGCQSSGSPGSRILNYSVGNHTSTGEIASTSSRGSGQDGEIKPNISAPGTAIRSSVPGSNYAAFSGTSMASPHVAGSVALAWGAAHDLVGDYDATRALFDESAIDTEDLSCGGTEADNNVFGEGKLDVLAAVNAAPVGPSGWIKGTLTSTATGEPIAAGSISIAGETDRVIRTNSAGEYSARVSEGDYEVTANAFGYEPKTENISVAADETTAHDFALDEATWGTTTGTVTDGSGYGFPLYARIFVVGTQLDTFTDPVTGAYELDLPAGTYTLRVDAQYPGYQRTVTEVVVDGDLNRDIVLEVDAATCSAPGYARSSSGLSESFDSGSLPEGWEITDRVDSGEIWRFDDPGKRGNLTGGEGGFATIDSDVFGKSGNQHTSLVTPSVDLSEVSNPSVTFHSDLRNYRELASVEVSLDGGDSWETVAEWTTGMTARGPRLETIPLPMAAGQSDVKVAFTYEATYGWWWQIDDVVVGERSCAATGDGGYVVGNVSAADGKGLVGATVTNLDDTEQTALATATPGDSNLEDGFYWLFSDTTGTHPFQARINRYADQVEDITVVDSGTVGADFVLGAGQLSIDPVEVDHTQTVDATSATDLTVRNSGDAAAEVELRVGRSGFTPADGPELIELDIQTTLGPEATVSGVTKDGTASPQAHQADQDPWQPLPDVPRPMLDNRVVEANGTWYTLGGFMGAEAFADVYAIDSDGEAWTAKAPMPEAKRQMSAAAIGDQIVVSQGWIDGGISKKTHIYDTKTDTWRAGADAPAPRAGAGVTVVDDIMYVVGGCTELYCSYDANSVYAYDIATDRWEVRADYPEGVSFLACGAIEGNLVCSGGTDMSMAGTKASYSYSPGTNAWTKLPDAPVRHWGAAYASGGDQLVITTGVQNNMVTNRTFAFDGEAWRTDLPNASTAVYRAGAACGMALVGGSVDYFDGIATAEVLPGLYCDTEPPAWLQVDPMSFSVPAGGSTTVTVTTDSSGLEPGVYTAQLRVIGDTPQDIPSVSVQMTVTDEEPADPEPGFRVLPSVKDETPDSVTIVWASALDTPGTVKVTGPGGKRTATSEPTLVKLPEFPGDSYEHVVQIDGLKAGKKYNYTVTQDGIEHTAKFTTPKKGKN